MIDDLIKTLRAILTQKGLPAPLDSAQIVFDHTSEKFNPQQATVDLFLYDIRRELERVCGKTKNIALSAGLYGVSDAPLNKTRDRNMKNVTPLEGGGRKHEGITPSLIRGSDAT